jgi:hypothetical protein
MNRASAGPDPARSRVALALKTPMAPRAILASLDRKKTLAEAVRELRQMLPASAGDCRLLEQLGREVTGPHEYLAIGALGELNRVDPERTTLGEISMPRKVRTPRGVETTEIAGLEVQAYAAVG